MADEISRQSSIGCIMWLLVITLMQIYNERQQAGQKKDKMYCSGRKREPKNVMSEPIPVFKEKRNLKKGLKLIGIKGVVPLGQDLTQPCSQIVKVKCLRYLPNARTSLSKKSDHQQIKIYANMSVGGSARL